MVSGNTKTMIKIAKAIIPPAVRAVLVELRNHHSLRFLGKIYTGVFATFDEVTRNFHGVVPYNSAESEREEVAKAPGSYAAVVDARRGIMPEPTDRFTLLCALVSTWPDPAPTILDVGGETGDTLAHLVYSCPRHEPRLVVYDLPPIVAAGRAAFRDDATIRFVDSLAEVDRPVDIVFMRGCLLYFEDYKSFLVQIIALRPRMIVIAYTPVTDAPTFVTAQVNNARRVIPIKVINRDDLIAYLDSLGFTLIHRSVARGAAHFRNFPLPQSKSAAMNLIFAAKD